MAGNGALAAPGGGADGAADGGGAAAAIGAVTVFAVSGALDARGAMGTLGAIASASAACAPAGAAAGSGSDEAGGGGRGGRGVRIIRRRRRCVEQLREAEKTQAEPRQRLHLRGRDALLVELHAQRAHELVITAFRDEEPLALPDLLDHGLLAGRALHQDAKQLGFVGGKRGDDVAARKRHRLTIEYDTAVDLVLAQNMAFLTV